MDDAFSIKGYRLLAMAVGTLPSCYVSTCCNIIQGDGVAQVVDDYSSKGYRLLAMAVGTLPKLDEADLPGLSQQQLEMQCSQMELLALVVLTNHVRPDSRDTITQLQDG